MNVAIYARVSTADQSCDMQLHELRQYVQRRDWQVFAEYVDTGYSGSTASRPELDRLLTDARLRKFEAVLVWKLDRWGRSVAHIHTGLVLRMFGEVVYFQVWLVTVVALAAGALVGAVNGLLVAQLRVPPFIATLGTLYVARGAAMLLSNGATFPNLAGKAALGNTGFLALGSGSLFAIPVPIWLMLVFGLVGAFLAGRTPFGRHVYAVGGNERAAELSGVRVGRIKFAVYVISGVCGAMVGLIIASQLAAAHPATGETFELNAIAAVVLGGTSLMGGRGNIGGTIIGAFVIGVLADGLVLLGVSEFWQMVIKGLVIVLAVILDQMQQRYSRRSAA